MVTNRKKRAGEVAGIAFCRETKIAGGFPLSPTQGTPSGNSPFARHGKKRKNETAGIALYWETQIVCRDLLLAGTPIERIERNASSTGHGKRPLPALLALYLGSVQSQCTIGCKASGEPQLAKLLISGTDRIRVVRHRGVPLPASPAPGDHQDEGPNCGVNCRHCVLCVRCHFAGSQLGRRTTVLGPHGSVGDLAGWPAHIFNGADLSKVEFDGADLTNADFTGAIVTGATFESATLTAVKGLDLSRIK